MGASTTEAETGSSLPGLDRGEPSAITSEEALEAFCRGKVRWEPNAYIRWLGVPDILSSFWERCVGCTGQGQPGRHGIPHFFKV